MEDTYVDAKAEIAQAAEQAASEIDRQLAQLANVCGVLEGLARQRKARAKACAPLMQYMCDDPSCFTCPGVRDMIEGWGDGGFYQRQVHNAVTALDGVIERLGEERELLALPSLEPEDNA